VLILVRHGRTALNAQGRLQGHIDAPLDELGLLQADAVAAALPPADLVISSPLCRARQTAQAFGAPVVVDERWIELNYGELDGRTMSSLGSAMWDGWIGDANFAPPGGESMAELEKRVVGACEDLRSSMTELVVVVVSHVSPIKAALGWVLGLPTVDAGWRMHLDPASISRVHVGPRGPVLRSFNETIHLVDVTVNVTKI
jgi:broad specificity phosphatase PhoE